MSSSFERGHKIVVSGDGCSEAAARCWLGEGEDTWFQDLDGEGSLVYWKNFLSLLPMFFFFFSREGSRCSDCGRCSIESLLRSLFEDEVPIKRDRLAMLERLRRRDSISLGSDDRDDVRSPNRCGLTSGKPPCIALVIVDREDVKEGTSVEMRTSGPGSPKRGDGMTG